MCSNRLKRKAAKLGVDQNLAAERHCGSIVMNTVVAARSSESLVRQAKLGISSAESDRI
jgi:hypothetical protein